MEPILGALTKLIQTEPEVELLNHFKSYPLPVYGSILSMDSKGTALVRVSAPGSVCLYHNKTTILVSNALEDAVYAKVIHFDIVEDLVTLGGFSYLGSSSGLRRIIRVQPEQTMPIILQREDLTIKGVTVTKMIVKKGDSFQVLISFPTGETTIPGSVIQITPQNENMRLAIKFTSNSRNIALIMKYMADRRLEIQTEIEGLYAKVLQTAKA
jgi:hypothetical protein